MPAEPPETSPDAGRVTPPRAYAMLHFTRCWDCQFGDHREPPEWHTWAEAEDIAHAARTGQPDPSTSRCACSCCEVI